MFELPVNFDKNIIEIKETKLKDGIVNNKSINKETQLKTIDFIIKAKNIILNASNNSVPFLKKIENMYNSSFELKSVDLENNDEHMVQLRKEKQYLSSFPSEYFPGIINPLKKRTIKKNLNIDTRFRENYFANQSTNFNFTLPININDVIQMQLAAIELPNTYYVISNQYGNNFFTITVNTSTTVIYIPEGNYDTNTIMTAINNQLSLAGTPFNQVNFVANGCGKTMVELNEDNTIEINFQADKNGIDDRNTPLPLKLGWLLGFRNGIYINKNNLNYVSEGIIDVSGPKYLFLVIDDHNNSVNNNFYAAFNSSILNKNILARISLQSSAFNTFEQNNLTLITTPREYFGPVNIQTINVQLLDEYGRVVDLNNMDYSFCITLVTVYDI
jgi:hypothetical protein